MRALVTGAAGFIGSHLVDRLLAEGWNVLAVDCFTPYYDRLAKLRNLEAALKDRRLSFIELDLRRCEFEFLDGVDVVFHQAAQAGVRPSWADGFEDYADHNVLVTQRLLEGARLWRVPRLIYASSSSVYGNASDYPTRESDLPRPHNPYGVTKLAAEHLCSLYGDNFGLSTVSLRYFTVYGPRQRPDMAIHRLVEAAIRHRSFELYGSGEQIRDFTFVDDVINANLLAAEADAAPGTVCNVAGGGSTTMNRLIELVSERAGSFPVVRRSPAKAGDVARTGGAVDLAQELLGWKPTTSLQDGLASQVAWHRALREAPQVSHH